MDRILITLASMLFVVFAVGILLLGDLLRHANKRAVRLRYYLHDARQLLQRHVRLCHRCQGLGYLLMRPAPPETMSHTEPCPRCGQTKDFLDKSAGL